MLYFLIAEGKCREDEYLCSTGNCISSDYLCDGYFDCLDGADEQVTALELTKSLVQ